MSIPTLVVRLTADDTNEEYERVNFMLLIHQGATPTPLDPEAWAALSEEEQQAVYDAYKSINATPGVTPGNGLRPPETATTVRVHDGKTITTTGRSSTPSSASSTTSTSPRRPPRRRLPSPRPDGPTAVFRPIPGHGW
jgi:hypothetical protein